MRSFNTYFKTLNDEVNYYYYKLHRIKMFLLTQGPGLRYKSMSGEPQNNIDVLS